jgi:creatinine amidohydrolase
MIQYLNSDLVHDDRLEQARDEGYSGDFGESYLRNGSRTFYDAIDNTGNGVLGDQTDASAEKGEELFEAASDQLVELIEWLRARESDELLPKPHV